MQTSTRTSYLEAEIMTATPQKLQVMLIEAAMRLIKRARGHWHAEEDEKAPAALGRAQRVPTELLCGLNREVEPELTKKVAAVYLFVFRILVDANLTGDQRKLDDALRVLEIERETWREVCRELGISKEAGDRSAAISPGESAFEPHAPPAGQSADSGFAGETPGGLSLEA